jgi:hypothetical protein
MTSPNTRAAAVVGLAAVLFVVALGVSRQKEHPPRAAEPAPRRDDPQPPGPTSTDATRYDENLVYKPTPVPDRVILTWKGDPATSQAVTWRTDTSVKGAVGQIVLADDGPGIEPGWRGYDPKKVTQVAARTERLKTAINEALYHRVNFAGLKPNTRYVYRVGDGANWSEWFQFETASDRPEPFGFIYFGDAQNGIRSLWSRVARGAYSDMPKARFIVHAGDLVDSGRSDTQWGEWHAAAGWINGMVPSVPTPGNHEYVGGLTPHWRAQYTLPENGPPGLEETCYYFDFQGVRLIGLNSNEKLPEQAKWAEKVLADNPNRWTVVMFHHPVYSPAPGRDNETLRKTWRPVFDAAPKGVDLVLQGHDHTYGRSGLMLRDNTLGGGQAHTARGTVYVVSISGSKMYTAGEKPWMVRKASGLQLYQLIRIDGDRLTYEARTAKGDLYDAFELRKRADGGNDLFEKDSPLPPEAEAGPESAAPGAVGSSGGDGNGRDRWNAVAAVLILGLVTAGVGWALRKRKTERG